MWTPCPALLHRSSAKGDVVAAGLLESRIAYGDFERAATATRSFAVLAWRHEVAARRHHIKNSHAEKTDAPDGKLCGAVRRPTHTVELRVASVWPLTPKAPSN